MRRATLLGVLTAGLAGFAAPAMAANQTVQVGPDHAYHEDRVAVKPNEAVTWNDGPSHDIHNVHFEDNSFVDPSPPLTGPWTRTRTFTGTPPGAYRYYCDEHRNEGMTGVVYVNNLGNLPPFVTFTAFANPAEVGQRVSFDANQSSDDDGINGLVWQFGDGAQVDAGTTRTTSHIYTSAGAFNVKLRVTENMGLAEERVVAVRVDPASPPPPPPTPGASTAIAPGITTPSVLADTTLPAVTNYGLTNKSFRVDKASTPTSGKAAAVKGTTFKYTLSEAATVKIDLQQLQPGRKKGKACVKPTAKLKKVKKCVRAVSQGTLTRTSQAGVNAVAFTGRVGSRALSPGNYQAVLSASDAAGNRSLRKTVTFKIVRR